MNWININVTILDSPEFVGAEPTARATWLCLLRYCAGQENGGRIVAARTWKDRKWQQVARVTIGEVEAESELWKWDGEDLVVFEYPVEKEKELRVKRSAGRAGGSKTSEAKTRAARKNGAKSVEYSANGDPSTHSNNNQRAESTSPYPSSDSESTPCPVDEMIPDDAAEISQQFTVNQASQRVPQAEHTTVPQAETEAETQRKGKERKGMEWKEKEVCESTHARSGIYDEPLPRRPAFDLPAMQAWINSLHPSWKARPHFSRVERGELQANVRIFTDLTAHDRSLLAAYMDALVPESWGIRKWQPDHRGQFIRHVTDVLSHADVWLKECRRRGENGGFLPNENLDVAST